MKSLVRQYSCEEWMKHLELIQGIVNRMTGYSSLMKGWGITLVAAILAVAAKDVNPRFALTAFFPTFIFWGLDAYYLRQERLFRKLYDHIRIHGDPATAGTIEPFTMNTTPFSKDVQSWPRTLFTRVISPLYVVILLVILAGTYLLAN